MSHRHPHSSWLLAIQLLFVLSAVLLGSVVAQDGCFCQHPAPCLYRGACAARVGGSCSPGSDECPTTTPDPNDNAAPVFSAGYPTAFSSTASSIGLAVAMSEPGYFYFVIFEAADNADSPTPAEVVAGTGAAGFTAVVAGSQAIGAKDSVHAVSINSGLQEQHTYDIWVVAVDVSQNQNLQSSVTHLTVTTAAPGPVFIGGYPKTKTITDIAVTATVQLLEPGTLYMVVLENGESAPTTEEAVLGTGPGGILPVAAAGPVTIPQGLTDVDATTTSGRLQPLTHYDLYVVCLDVDDNGQAAPTKLSFTTIADASNPSFVDGYPVAVEARSRELSVNVKLNEKGTAYGAAVLVTDNIAAPGFAAVKAGTVPSSTTATVVIAQEFTAMLLTFTGLNPGSAYDMYIVAEDQAEFAAASVKKVEMSTIPDSEPPEFETNFPLVTSITDKAAVVQLRLNEPGTAYVSILLASADAPTAAQLIAGNVPDAVVSGTANVVQASTSYSVVLQGLDPDTAYKAWVAARDSVLPAPNAMAQPVGKDFTTLQDSVAPVFTSPYPTINEVAMTTATLRVRMNEAGKAFYVVLPAGATAPTPSQVFSPGTYSPANTVVTSGDFDAAAASEATTSMQGLAHTTSYDVYVTAQDVMTPVANKQTDVTLRSFTTANDTAPPVFTSGGPSLAVVADSWVDVLLQLDEPGTVYFAVLPQNVSTAPSVAQVFDTPSSIAFVVAYGSADVAAGNTGVTKKVTGLVLASSYTLYLVAEDKSAAGVNRQTSLTSLSVLTKSDVTPPVFVAGPRLVEVRDVSVTLGATLNEKGTLFFIILARAASGNATTPTGAQVKAGSSYPGAIAWGSVAADTPSSEATVTAFGVLAGETEYDAYVTAMDSDNNVMSSAGPVLAFRTGDDQYPPEYSDQYPRAAGVDDFSVTLMVALDEPGRAYFVAVPEGSAAPSAAQVMAGLEADGSAAAVKGSIQVSTSDEAVAVSVDSGLKASTKYDVYFAAEDNRSPRNVATTTVKIQFETLTDHTPPLFDGGFPQVGTLGSSDDAFDVVFQLDEPADVYYVVVRTGAPVPARADIKLGNAAGGWSPKTKGKVVVGNSSTTLTLIPKDWDSETVAMSYTMFLVAEDALGNMQALVHDVLFNFDDKLPPSFIISYPRTNRVADRSFYVAVMTTEPCKAYVLVTNRLETDPEEHTSLGIDASPPTDDEPTPGNIIAGSAGSTGRVVVSAGTLDVTQARVSYNLKLTELEPVTDYNIYVVAEDFSPAKNRNLRAALVYQTTDIDSTPPADDDPSGQAHVTDPNIDDGDGGTVTVIVILVVVLALIALGTWYYVTKVKNKDKHGRKGHRSRRGRDDRSDSVWTKMKAVTAIISGGGKSKEQANEDLHRAGSWATPVMHPEFRKDSGSSAVSAADDKPLLKSKSKRGGKSSQSRGAEMTRKDSRRDRHSRDKHRSSSKRDIDHRSSSKRDISHRSSSKRDIDHRSSRKKDRDRDRRRDHDRHSSSRDRRDRRDRDERRGSHRDRDRRDSHRRDRSTRGHREDSDVSIPGSLN